MTIINLNRSFSEWQDKSGYDRGLASDFTSSNSNLSWDDLCAKKRVVILAEAGSGKTTEMREQVRLRSESSQFAFYLEVQDLGKQRLIESLKPQNKDLFNNWMRGDQPAWFFIDSVDEAKLTKLKLENSLRQLAHAIHNVEQRTHIVLSSRCTDWEYKYDLELFNRVLPFNGDNSEPVPPFSSPDDILIDVIRQESRAGFSKENQSALVFLMNSLNSTRVKKFAIECGNVEDVEEFIAEIDHNNLWRFVKRPRDLEWLVSFWKERKCLGTLKEILNANLSERLRERNSCRTDSVTDDEAWHALERVGAVFVFGRKNTLEIPDSKIDFSKLNDSFDLKNILPDWSSEQRKCFLSRPVFDPATFGRIRLHNDNQGIVSAYLTARWLNRLHQSNHLSRGILFNLLFAENYSIKVIKPSLRETAAWLAIEDQNDQRVAREITQREPFLLMSAGDPESLSVNIRKEIFQSAVQWILNGKQKPYLDYRYLKRFSKEDLAQAIEGVWFEYPNHEKVRCFLLELIYLGQLKKCAHLARENFDTKIKDRIIDSLSVNALIVTGDDTAKKKCAEYVTLNCSTLSGYIIWNTIESLFPKHLTIDNFLIILSTMDLICVDGGGFEFWQHDLDFINRVTQISDLEHLLEGMLIEVNKAKSDCNSKSYQTIKDLYFPLMAATALQLLKLSPEYEISNTVLDAILQFKGTYASVGRDQEYLNELDRLLSLTEARRKLVFWHAAQRLSEQAGHPMQFLGQMRALGWRGDLRAEDITWLLEDGKSRTVVNEKYLAMNAVLNIWKNNGLTQELQEKIVAKASIDSTMEQAYNDFIYPKTPSIEETKGIQEFEEIQLQNAAIAKNTDQSWKDFVGGIRADPQQLKKLRPTTTDSTDSRLLNLWKLLSQATGNNYYAINSVTPLEQIIGIQATAAVCDGLIAHWRAWEPTLKSKRELNKRSNMHFFDCMGITGITLESKKTGWPSYLNSEEVCRATAYATLEINGFPNWLSDLAHVKSQEVAGILLGEITSELENTGANFYCETLNNLAYSTAPALHELMAPYLLEVLKDKPHLALTELSLMLNIINRGLRNKKTEFLEFAISKFNELSDLDICSLYMKSVFVLNSAKATEVFMVKLKELNQDQRDSLALHLLPLLFGDIYSESIIGLSTIPFDCLKQWVKVAFETIRVKENNSHPPGSCYSPDLRDRAEEARSNLFTHLTKIPGHATFKFLTDLAEKSYLPAPSSRLYALAYNRAAEDSEDESWSPSNVVQFEKNAKARPKTSKDLQSLALSHFKDMQDELVNGDFNQGKTLAHLSGETAVQNFVADRLRSQQGQSYSVEREIHLAGEKKPDIRIRAKASDASVPIEVKIAENYSLQELEKALSDQLGKKYLRPQESKHGILLIVHQKHKKKWNKNLSFSDVLEHLCRKATEISDSEPNAPQIEIAFLDVTNCTTIIDD